MILYFTLTIQKYKIAHSFIVHSRFVQIRFLKYKKQTQNKKYLKNIFNNKNNILVYMVFGVYWCI